MKNTFYVLSFSSLIFSLGCQTLTKTKSNKYVATEPAVKVADLNPVKKLIKPSLPKGRATSIVAIWKDATYTVADQRPTRGFGGRLYFYDRENNPIVVDGVLIVYGFNDDEIGSNAKPEKRFVFDREKLASHMSVSAVGPSYNVWLPWDHINGVQKNVTIRAVFRGSDNSVCQSDPITSLLPGTKRPEMLETESFIDQIQGDSAIRTSIKKVGFVENMPKGTKKIKSQEIRIPAGSQERLFNSVPKSTYMLPTPKINLPEIQDETTTESSQSPSVDSLLRQRQAQSGQFARQGRLAPGKTPPQLGSRSSSATLH